jgi:hypothetical protein
MQGALAHLRIWCASAPCMFVSLDQDVWEKLLALKAVSKLNSERCLDYE